MAEKTLKQKKEYIDKQYDKYGTFDGIADKTIKKKVSKYLDELEENENQLGDKLGELFDNGKITIDQLGKYEKLLIHRKIFDIDDLLKSIDKKTTTKPQPITKKTLKQLVKEVEEIVPDLTTKHKTLIKKIPDDVYTTKTIYEIILGIHSGKYKSIKDFPSSNDGDKIKLSEAVKFKKTKGKGVYTTTSDDDYSSDDFEI